MLILVKTGPFASEDRKPEYPSDLEGGTHNLYIYCNLVEPASGHGKCQGAPPEKCINPKGSHCYHLL